MYGKGSWLTAGHGRWALSLRRRGGTLAWGDGKEVLGSKT